MSVLLTSPSIRICCKTPCGCTPESSRPSSSLYQPPAARRPGRTRGNAACGSAAPRWRTRRCWWGSSRWRSWAPEPWRCRGNSWVCIWYSEYSPSQAARAASRTSTLRITHTTRCPSEYRSRSQTLNDASQRRLSNSYLRSTIKENKTKEIKTMFVNFPSLAGRWNAQQVVITTLVLD